MKIARKVYHLISIFLLQTNSKIRKIIGLYTKKKELNYSIGKLPLPNFDGSSQSYANTLVQKLDVYFQLNLMVEEDALKMAIFHLEGDANKGWFHGMKTMGHDQVKTYG